MGPNERLVKCGPRSTLYLGAPQAPQNDVSDLFDPSFCQQSCTELDRIYVSFLRLGVCGLGYGDHSSVTDNVQGSFFCKGLRSMFVQVICQRQIVEMQYVLVGFWSSPDAGPADAS